MAVDLELVHNDQMVKAIIDRFIAKVKREEVQESIPLYSSPTMAFTKHRSKLSNENDPLPLTILGEIVSVDQNFYFDEVICYIREPIADESQHKVDGQDSMYLVRFKHDFAKEITKKNAKPGDVICIFKPSIEKSSDFGSSENEIEDPNEIHIKQLVIGNESDKNSESEVLIARLNSNDESNVNPHALANIFASHIKAAKQKHEHNLPASHSPAHSQASSQVTTLAPSQVSSLVPSPAFSHAASQAHLDNNSSPVLSSTKEESQESQEEMHKILKTNTGVETRQQSKLAAEQQRNSGPLFCYLSPSQQLQVQQQKHQQQKDEKEQLTSTKISHGQNKPKEDDSNEVKKPSQKRKMPDATAEEKKLKSARKKDNDDDDDGSTYKLADEDNGKVEKKKLKTGFKLKSEEDDDDDGTTYKLTSDEHNGKVVKKKLQEKKENGKVEKKKLKSKAKKDYGKEGKKKLKSKAKKDYRKVEKKKFKTEVKKEDGKVEKKKFKTEVKKEDGKVEKKKFNTEAKKKDVKVEKEMLKSKAKKDVGKVEKKKLKTEAKKDYGKAGNKKLKSEAKKEVGKVEKI